MLLIPPLLLNTSTVLLRAFVLAPVALRNRSTVATLWHKHKWAVIGVGLLSELAYLLVLTAMQTTPVSYVAPARKISILIGTIMGARLLAEGHLRQRLVTAGAIVIGVVALAMG